MATRRNPRSGTGRGRELGIDDRDIPGGLEHISNAETHSQKAPAKASRQIPAMNEHGVADYDPDAPYDQPEAGQIVTPEPVAESREHYAVPVYMVPEPGKVGRVRRDVIADRMQIAAQGNPATRVASADDNRVMVSLLCDDAANDVRIAHEEATLAEGGGALLSHSATGYLHLPAQGDIYAISVAGSVSHLSYVLVTENTV